MTESPTAAAALVQLLSKTGFDTIFGIPGVHTLAFYKAIGESGLRHVNARHEQGAAFMADGYARACGKPGLCVLISGPGVTNAATPIGQAFSDSVPILILSSAIARDELGLARGMLHEITDQRAATAPLTALSVLAISPHQIGEHFAHAMALFSSCRPRPVHISIPLDVLDAPAAPFVQRRSLPPSSPPDSQTIERAALLLHSAKRPAIVLGGGAKDADAEMTRLAELLKAPVVTTIAGKGVVPESHPLSLGATLPRRETRRLIEKEADIVLAIGTELGEPDLYVAADSEATTGSEPRPDTTRLTLAGRLIRVDIDPASTIRDYAPDVAIAADACKTAAMLVDSLLHLGPVSSSWGMDFVAHHRMLKQGASPLEKRHLAILDAVRRALPKDALIYADMTQIAYTACMFFPVERSRAFMFPTGYGTLGYALPAAIGGALACPARSCAVLAGDGGLLFTIQELATAVELGLPMPIILWDNYGFGEIDDLMRARRISPIGVKPRNPKFPSLVESFGCNLAEPKSVTEIEQAVGAALVADGPTVIYVRQDAF